MHTVADLTNALANTAVGHMVLAPGTYNLTGSSPSLLVGRALDTTPGQYDLTGSSSAMLFDSLVSVTPGDYDITGSDAAMLFDQMVEVAPGAYSITGTDPVLLYDRVVITSIGQYSISGTPVTLVLQGGIVWPSPSDVKLGVEYGPTGIEYTGTMLSGQIWLRRR